MAPTIRYELDTERQPISSLLLLQVSNSVATDDELKTVAYVLE